jgi:transcriptional/translational regulatory protein YebC/TACO1
MGTVGGSDLEKNVALAQIIQKAKKNNVNKALIETAIARGQGQSVSGEKLHTFVEEAMLPPSTALIIDCLTENQSRTQMEVRKVLKDFGGKPSSTAFLFSRRGQVVFEAQEDKTAETLMDEAIEAGAVDIFDVDDTVVVETEVEDLNRITESLSQKLGSVRDSQLVWSPIEQSEAESEELQAQLDVLVSKLKEVPSVQAVYSSVATKC